MENTKKKETRQSRQAREEQSAKPTPAKERETKIINIYRNIPTEDRIRLYLKICGYVMNGEELQ